MEPESSLTYSQALATYPYPEPIPSSPHNPFPLQLRNYFNWKDEINPKQQSHI